MIHAVANTKGGTGKSTVAFHVLCSEAARLGRDFMILEIDEKNLTSEVFNKSPILSGRSKTLTLESTIEAIGEAIFESIVENKEVIIDMGGGRDTDEVLHALAQTGEPIRYYVPMESEEAQIVNAIQTIDLIESAGGKANLVLNRTKGWNVNDCGADDIFGNQALGIKANKTIIDRVSSIYFIPDNPYFAHAQRENQILGDFIKEGSIPVEEMKIILSNMAMQKAHESGEKGSEIFSNLWKLWIELRKAYEFNEHIVAQNILGI